MKSKTVRRVLRVIAFGVATGIIFIGAGNIWGFDALESAGFGATGAVLGLLAVLLFTYAGKDKVSDEDFNTAINDAIEHVNSKVNNKSK